MAQIAQMAQNPLKAATYTNHKKYDLFLAVLKCDIKKVEDLISKGIDPNTRFSNNELTLHKAGQLNISMDSKVGLTPLALLGLWPCDDNRLYDKEVLNNTIERKKNLIEKLIELGADPHLKVDMTSSCVYGGEIPSYFTPFCSDLGSLFATPLAIEAIKNGANPNEIDSNGNNILRIAYVNDSPLKTYQDLMAVGVSFKHVTHRGYNQSAILPVPSISIKENYLLADQVISDGINFSLGDFENFYSNGLNNIIERLWHRYTPSDGQTIETFKEIEMVLLKKMPHLINQPDRTEGKTPIMGMMKLICPASTFENGYHINTFKSTNEYNHLSTRDEHYRISIYKWFLKFIENNKFDLNLIDNKGNGYLAYSLNLCPFPVTEILIKKGLSPKSFILKNDNIKETFESMVGNQKYSYIKKIPFNNDKRNFNFFTKYYPLAKLDDLSEFTFQNEEKVKIDSILAIKNQRIQDLGLDIDGNFNFSATFLFKYKKFLRKKSWLINLSKLSQSKSIALKNPLSFVGHSSCEDQSKQTIWGRGVENPSEILIEYRVISRFVLNIKNEGDQPNSIYNCVQDIDKYRCINNDTNENDSFENLTKEKDFKKSEIEQIRQIEFNIKGATTQTQYLEIPIDGPDWCLNIVTHDNETFKKIKKYRHENITIANGEIFNFFPFHSNFGNEQKYLDMKFLFAARDFTCNNQLCQLITVDKSKKGVLPLKFDSSQSHLLEKKEKFVVDFIFSDNKRKLNMLKSIDKNSLHETAPYLIDLINEKASTIEEESINRIIYSILLKVAYNHENYIDKKRLSSIFPKPMTLDGRNDYAIKKYLITGEGKEKAFEYLLTSKETIDLLGTILKQNDIVNEAIKIKIILLIDHLNNNKKLLIKNKIIPSTNFKFLVVPDREKL